MNRLELTSGACNEKAAQPGSVGGRMSGINRTIHRNTTTRGAVGARPMPREWRAAIAECAEQITTFDRYWELVARVCEGMTLADLKAFTAELKGGRQ